MKKQLLLLFLFSIVTLKSEAQRFTQNFTSSTVVADYVSATPNIGQFNAISTSGSGTVVSISNNALSFVRSGTNAGSFSRTTDFSGPPALLSIKMTVSVSGNTVASVPAAVFQIGSGFGTANSEEVNANVHSRFGINFTVTNGNFSLRNIGSSSNSFASPGAQNLTFVVNNGGSDALYLAPDGSNETLANDTWDLWVGTTKAFNDVAATTPTVDITDIKFVMSAGTGTMNITNLIIDDLTNLPIALSSFNGKANLQTVDLNWKTETELNSSHFEVLRSNENKSFVQIGRVDAAVNSSTTKKYAFNDPTPLPGTNYYQLRKVDADGKTELSERIAVKSNAISSNFKIISNRDKNTVDVTIFSAANSNATFRIFDLSGKKLSDQSLKLEKGFNTFSVSVQATSQGVHIASLVTNTEKITNKFIQ